MIGRLCLLGVSLGCLIGCQVNKVAFGECSYRIKTGECVEQVAVDSDLTESSFVAADRLLGNALVRLEPEHVILVTTLADIDNLRDSSSLGRLISEQLSARLAQQGYQVRESRLQDRLSIISRRGEFVLSRETRYLAESYQAQAVLAGNYAAAKDVLYVNLRLVEVKTAQVIASHAYSLPLGPNTQMLLQKRGWWLL